MKATQLRLLRQFGWVNVDNNGEPYITIAVEDEIHPQRQQLS